MPFRVGRELRSQLMALDWAARDESQGTVRVGTLRAEFADKMVRLMNEARPATIKLEKIKLLALTRGTNDPLARQILEVLEGKEPK